MNLLELNISANTRVTSVRYKNFLLGSFSVVKFGIAPNFDPKILFWAKSQFGYSRSCVPKLNFITRRKSFNHILGNTYLYLVINFYFGIKLFGRG